MYIFIILPLVFPILAVTARRFHDFGHSGWIQLGFYIPMNNDELPAKDTYSEPCATSPMIAKYPQRDKFPGLHAQKTTLPPSTC